MLTPITSDRLARAKRAFSTRRVPNAALQAVIKDGQAPRAGDLVLARVVEIGQHDKIELPTSRKATLFLGDEIILAYGNRYAPDQFEALVPGDLGSCEMVAGGGIAGRVVARHARMEDATKIEPIGVFVDESLAAVNVRDYALPSSGLSHAIPAIAVAGGSMNAGKTTTCAHLVHGLAKAGYKVGAAKITGTGAGNDFWHMKDAGACAVYDFTDAGLATTYKASLFEVERCAATLASALAHDGADVMVFEIADGLYQEETAALVKSRTMRALASGWLYAAESAASAAMGVQWLRQMGHPVLGVSGLVSASPLASREAENATGFPCLTKDVLGSAEQARVFMRAMSASSEALAA